MGQLPPLPASKLRLLVIVQRLWYNWIGREPDTRERTSALQKTQYIQSRALYAITGEHNSKVIILRRLS